MPFDSQPTLGGELLSARPLQATEHSALYAVASDASPLAPHTRDVIYLGDGEIALITPESHLPSEE